MKHCFHLNNTQARTYTSADVDHYTCCFCGTPGIAKHTYDFVEGHGPHVPMVKRRTIGSIDKADEECPKRSEYIVDEGDVLL